MLHSDDGLWALPDYTDDELAAIFASMATRSHYAVANHASRVVDQAEPH